MLSTLPVSKYGTAALEINTMEETKAIEKKIKKCRMGFNLILRRYISFRILYPSEKVLSLLVDPSFLDEYSEFSSTTDAFIHDACAFSSTSISNPLDFEGNVLAKFESNNR